MSAAARVRALALALGLCAAALALANQRQVGIARDETVYFAAGSRYASWWLGVLAGERSLDATSITAAFGGRGATDNNREHPPLMKTWSGLSEHLLHDRWGLLDEVSAYRAPAAALHGLLIALILSFAARAFGLGSGLCAALAMLLLPRALLHAGLACFDGPITTLWFATLWAYHRALSRPRLALLAAVAFGLALATKHNALMLPAVIGAHYLAWAWPRRLIWKRLALPLTIAVGGPLVALALWPWLWLAPLAHAAQWIAFHLHHVHYNYEYLGKNWNAPPFPWHVPLVTTALTTPVATLASSLVGSAVLLLRRREPAANEPAEGGSAEGRPGLLLALSAAVAMGPFFLGSTPIFGAEKHWQPALPSLAIAAGVGITAMGRALGAIAALRWPRARAPLAFGFAALLLGSAAVETLHPQPYALTAYNALAGGAPGAADLGMNRQFWGLAARGVLGELTRAAPPGAASVPVYFHDAAPAAPWYVAAGLLSARFYDAGPERPGIAQSQLALVVHERHFLRHELFLWQEYGTAAPIFVLTLDGVPLVSLYRRPSAPASVPAPQTPLP